MKRKLQSRRFPIPLPTTDIERVYREHLWNILANVKRNVDFHLAPLIARHSQIRQDSIVVVDPRSLIAHQIIDTDKMAAMAKSFVYLKHLPIVAHLPDGKLTIIDGHHRVAAAISNGVTSLYVSKPDSLNEKQIEEYRKQTEGLPFTRADRSVMEHRLHYDHFRNHSIRLDDWKSESNKVFNQLRSIGEQATAHAKQLAAHTSNLVKERNKKNFQRTIRSALAIDIIHDAPAMAETVSVFAINNVQLIESLPDQYLDQVHEVLEAGFEAGDRAEDIADDLMERFEVSESRAVLIARDQVGKLNGALTQDRQENLGIKGYTWRTSRDERVRDSHAANEGEYFTWDDPNPETGHPGEDIQCRCHADPDLSEMFSDDEEDQ